MLVVTNEIKLMAEYRGSCDSWIAEFLVAQTELKKGDWCYYYVNMNMVKTN